MTGRHKSPTSLTPQGGVGPTPARDSTPGAGRATTTEVEGAYDAAGSAPGVRAIPRWSWALVDGAGRRLREGSVLFLLALFVAAPSVALGLAFALVAARRGVAW